MGKRWAIASDPALLARIEKQEQSRAARGLQKEQVPPQAGEGRVRPQNGDSGAGSDRKPSQARLRSQKVALNNQDSRADFASYCAATNSLMMVFPRAMILGLNTSLRMHDAHQTKLKTTWFKRVEAMRYLWASEVQQWIESATYPVIIEEIYATSENICLDVEGFTSGCKPIVDALVHNGILPDDSPKYVAQPLGYTFRQKNRGVVIRLVPTTKAWGRIDDSSIDAAKAIPGD